MSSRVVVMLWVAMIVGSVKVAVLVIVKTGVTVVAEVAVTMLTSTSVDVEAMDVDVLRIVLVICMVKVELA